VIDLALELEAERVANRNARLLHRHSREARRADHVASGETPSALVA
jgi:hypothetical protein